MPLRHDDTKKHKVFEPLSENEEKTGKLIVNAAFLGNKELGQRFVAKKT